jgi:hypothetical protein
LRLSRLYSQNKGKPLSAQESSRRRPCTQHSRITPHIIVRTSFRAKICSASPCAPRPSGLNSIAAPSAGPPSPRPPARVRRRHGAPGSHNEPRGLMQMPGMAPAAWRRAARGSGFVQLAFLLAFLHVVSSRALQPTPQPQRNHQARLVAQTLPCTDAATFLPSCRPPPPNGTTRASPTPLSLAACLSASKRMPSYPHRPQPTCRPSHPAAVLPAPCPSALASLLKLRQSGTERLPVRLLCVQPACPVCSLAAED